MILLLSGEGPTDIGQMDAGQFEPGPMARLADTIIQQTQGFDYSYIENKSLVFIHKTELKGTRPKALLVGKKRPANTPEDKWFLRNAATLAFKAIEVAYERTDTTLAILFRDADRTAEYEQKRKSIADGFKLANYPNGIAMVPLPTSEAWLLSSALGCGNKLEGKHLEDWTDKDSLKVRLGTMIGKISVRELNPDPDSISSDLDSYSQFRSELENCVKTIFRTG